MFVIGRYATMNHRHIIAATALVFAWIALCALAALGTMILLDGGR